MSVPATIDLPRSYRRVAWPGRLGSIAAVAGRPAEALGDALLVPGFTGSKEDYYAILDPLYERGWAVMAVDLPGMAESEGPPQTEPYDLPQLADDVVDMMRQCSAASPEPRPVHLVGHSVGGLIAREAALRAPGLVASLTLYDSGTGAVGDRAREDVEALQRALRTQPPSAVHRMKESLDAAAGKPAPPEHIAEFLRRRWATTSPGHLHGMADIALTAPDRLAALADLSAARGLPILVLYGQNDDDTWPQADFAALAARIATSTAVISDAAHSPAVENPVAMVAALDAFWRAAR